MDVRINFITSNKSLYNLRSQEKNGNNNRRVFYNYYSANKPSSNLAVEYFRFIKQPVRKWDQTIESS